MKGIFAEEHEAEMKKNTIYRTERILMSLLPKFYIFFARSFDIQFVPVAKRICLTVVLFSAKNRVSLPVAYTLPRVPHLPPAPRKGPPWPAP